MDKDLSLFVADGNVRLTWIAFFTQFVLLGAVYLLRHVVGDAEKTAATSEDPETAAKKSALNLSAPDGFAARVAHLYRVLQENTFLLLCVLVLNTFGNGSTRAVMIITWIYFAFTVVCAFSELIYANRFIRLGYSAIFYALTLAMGGLAFAQGW
ncbi:hypothetical protein BDB00DRAFT_854226 [Zychaea mexicana]|uniref:uncharacterized protein n=1 Tax=Zychaea mexicana TaxID=64656 RepID=UPI0022FE5EF9|nr:uncharacterized protein BDB00DRAFT_854226 [Zychaea mexicana]KAI9484651.1 hypothetical protein BDB00DRAFT_854226 [Zychaea mexicana]